MKTRTWNYASRLTGRLLIVMALLATGASVVKATPTKTLVQDTLYRADGSAAQGSLTIRWNAFTTNAGEAVAAGEMTVSTGANGAISIPLIPNAGTTPAGGYYKVVVKLSDGSTSEETWVVPATATTTLAVIRAQIVPQSVAAQFVSRTYVDGEFAELAPVATSGSYSDLKNTPLIPNLATPGAIGATTPNVVYATDSIAKTTPYVDVRAYGAKGNGKDDDTLAIQSALTAAGSSQVLLPQGMTFKACGLVMPQYGKISGYGARLVASGTNCTVLSEATQAPFQSSDKPGIYGLTIDCANGTRVSGLTLGGGTAAFTLRDVSAVNCSDTGMHGIRYDGAQFIEASGVTSNSNYVGLKLYSISGGGGNSNTFYGLHMAGNVVGVLAGQLGVFGQGQNYFFNPTINQSAVAAFAVFGGSWQQDIHIFGGAPEANAYGTATSVTIDGFVVQRAMLYANNANVFVSDMTDADAVANPLFLLANNSTLSLVNVSGYGNTNGAAVSADSTSRALILGEYSLLATANGITQYPSSFGLGTSRVNMIGAPITSIGSDIPNLYSGNSFNMVFSDINGSVSQQTYSDPIYGTVNSVTHAASVGGSETNRVNIAGVAIPATPVVSDMVVSLLVKADRNCAYTFFQYGAGGSGFTVNLTANQWTRVLQIAPKQAAGQSYDLVGYPADASGPTVSFTRLMTYAGASGTPATLQAIGRISSLGLIYVPNFMDSTGTIAGPSGTFAGAVSSKTGTFSNSVTAPVFYGQLGTTQSQVNQTKGALSSDANDFWIQNNGRFTKFLNGNTTTWVIDDSGNLLPNGNGTQNLGANGNYLLGVNTNFLHVSHDLFANTFSIGSNMVLPSTLTGYNGSPLGVRVPLALQWNTPSTLAAVCHDANGNLTDSGCSSGATLTTTSATSDAVTVQGMTGGGHCSLTATNLSAATNLASTYVSAKAANQITVTHAAAAGMTYDVLCTSN